MTRKQMMTLDIESLKKYFVIDGLMSIDFNEDENIIEASMYCRPFMATFNGWEKVDKGNQYLLMRRFKNVVYKTYVPMDMYREYLEGVKL